MLYPKPYTSHTDQIAILLSRGLHTADPSHAVKCLERIGYYRLSAYWYPFRNAHLYPHTGRGIPPINRVGPPDRFVTDLFRAGYSFEDAVDFYVFDKKLRTLIGDALERIEVCVRGRMVDHLGKISPLAHRDASNFSRTFTTGPSRKPNLTLYQDWLQRQDKLFERSKEDFANHFRLKYGGSGLHPAIWVSSEAWDWGALSHGFGGLPPADKHAIASIFDNMNGHDLASWVRHLNDIRNVCAHHSRLWNRNTANPPRLPQQGHINLLDHLHTHPMIVHRLYGGIAICAYMMRIIHPRSQWHIRLRDFLLAEAPTQSAISPLIAGFPQGWENERLWQ